jgi:hypothetical protein
MEVFLSRLPLILALDSTECKICREEVSPLAIGENSDVNSVSTRLQNAIEKNIEDTDGSIAVCLSTCLHSCCIQCLSAHARNSLTAESLAPAAAGKDPGIRCPEPDCNEVLTDAEVRFLLTARCSAMPPSDDGNTSSPHPPHPSKVELYEQLLVNLAVSRSESPPPASETKKVWRPPCLPRRCRTSGCAYWVTWSESATPREMHVGMRHACPCCLKSMCVRCGRQPWHPGKPCEVAASEDLDDEGDGVFPSIWAKELSQVEWTKEDMVAIAEVRLVEAGADAGHGSQRPATVPPRAKAVEESSTAAYLRRNSRSIHHRHNTSISTPSMWECPNCSVCIERNEGCNHMMCKCGTRFCYNCGLITVTEKFKCKCGLYGNGDSTV